MWLVAVAQQKDFALAEAGLAAKGFPAFFPKIKKSKAIRGRVVEKDLPLFGRYFFIHFVDRWYDLFSIRGIQQILMNGERPSEIPPIVVDRIKQDIADGLYDPEKPKHFRKGQKLKLADGIFKGRYVFWERQSSLEREIVLLKTLGHYTKLEVAAASLID